MAVPIHDSMYLQSTVSSLLLAQGKEPWPALSPLKIFKQNTGWLVPHCQPLAPKFKPTLLICSELSSVERYPGLVFDSLCITVHTYCGCSYFQLRTMHEWIPFYFWNMSVKTDCKEISGPNFFETGFGPKFLEGSLSAQG